MRLRDYAYECAKGNTTKFSLSDYLKLAAVRLDIPNLDSFLEKSLVSGNCLVMLDGLDEVSVGIRKYVEEAIKAFILKYRATSSNGADNFNRFLITSRVAGYDFETFSDYPHYTITELTAKQGEEFLIRWYEANIRRNQPEKEFEILTEKAVQMTKSFTDALESNQSVRELAENPLLLALLAVMQQNSIVLSRGRAELCSVVTRAFLENRDIAKSLPPIPEEVAVHRLGLIAFKMQGTGNSFIHQREVLKLLTQSIALEGGTPNEMAQEAKNFLMRIRERGGIFVQRCGDYFGFLHRIFQEYFAARYILAEIGRDSDYWLPELIRRGHRTDNLWRETFLLAVAYASSVDEALANQIIQALLDTSPEGDHKGQEHDLLLDAECLIETKPFTIDPNLEKRIAEQLLVFYQKAQNRQKPQIENIMRHWLESLPKEAYRPVLPSILLEATSDKQNTARQNATSTLLAKIDWTKYVESRGLESEYTMAD